MVDKLFDISFKGRHSKTWRFNTEELCMSTEVNFFKGIGENGTGAHSPGDKSWKKKKSNWYAEES